MTYGRRWICTGSRRMTKGSAAISWSRWSRFISVAGDPGRAFFSRLETPERDYCLGGSDETTGCRTEHRASAFAPVAARGSCSVRGYERGPGSDAILPRDHERGAEPGHGGSLRGIDRRTRLGLLGAGATATEAVS